MSMSSESSDGEENAPAIFPFEVFPEEPRIEKTISSHNKKMLATGGFTFYFGYSTTLHVKQANGNINQTPAEVYHCSERLRRTCKMMIWIGQQDRYIQHRGHHSHHANPVSLGKRGVMVKAKQLMRDDPVTMTAKKARIEALSEAHSGIVAVMKEQNLDGVLQLEKHRGFPVPTGKTGPMHLEIPDDLKLLGGHPFVFYDSGKGKDRVIGMSTAELLTVLCDGEENADDGTFKVIKPEKHWSQVFAQHVNLRGRFIPAVVWFLAKATTEVFMRILKALNDWSMQNLSKPFRPKRILTDNEGAQRAPIREFFQTFNHPVEHRTCWFHFVQALMKNLKDYGLLDVYYNSMSFYLFVRKLCCLALIDPAFVGTALECLKQEAMNFSEKQWYQKVGMYINYFESTWVQRRNRFGQMVEGRIPKRYWNQYDAAKAGRATTTSSLEGWNRRTTDAAEKYPKKSIWYLLHHFKNEIGKESHQRVLRLSQGIGLAETSNLAQKRKVEGIKEALAVFNPEEISNGMARMANAIDDIQLDDLSFDGS